MGRYELPTDSLYVKFILYKHMVPHRRRTCNGAQKAIFTSRVAMPTSYLRDNIRTRNPKGALVSPSKRKLGNHLVSLHSKFYFK